MRKMRWMSALLSLVLALTLAVPAFAQTDTQVQAAQRLYSYGLFKGTGTLEDGSPDFALDRAPSRAEGVTMLVRLLGKDSEALNGTWSAPFTDVPAWATPYISYAYTKGYTTGIDATHFDPDTAISPSQYLTLVLRALGYTSGQDFAWDSAWTLSDALGITHGEYNAQTPFSRGDVVLISSSALDVSPRGESRTLLETIQDAESAEPTQPTQPTEPTTPSEPSTPSTPVSGMVWIPATGKKYHSIPNCGNMNPNKATQITLEEAKARGIQPCSKCW